MPGYDPPSWEEIEKDRQTKLIGHLKYQVRKLRRELRKALESEAKKTRELAKLTRKMYKGQL